MKKLILSFALFASLFTAAFAENLFSHRFFEIKLDVPVNVSNNLIAVADIFKEKVVIDLPKIADDIYTLVCGPHSVKINTHLKTPSACETVKNEDGTVTLKCGDKSATTIRGEDGEDASVCKYVDNEDGTVMQVCGDVGVVLYGDYCGEEPYDPDTAFCYGVTLFPKCGGYVYDVLTQACSDTNTVLERCGEILYDPTVST